MTCTTKYSTEIMPCVRLTKHDNCGMIYFVKSDFIYKEYDMLPHAHTHRLKVTISFTQSMSSNHRNLHIYMLLSMTSCFLHYNYVLEQYLTSSALN